MTQKAIIILLFLAVLALAGRWYFDRDLVPREILQTTEAKIKRLTNSIDSVKAAQRLTRDTLEAVYAVMQAKAKEAEQARIERQQLQRRYENIIYKPLLTDSARYNAIRILYPTEGF